MATTFILCPGQGAQAVGMGRDLLEGAASGRSLFARASSVLGYDLAEVCLTGPAERLNQTDVCQPALFVCGVASYSAAVEAGRIDASSISSVAGLSLGEYTALHLAGVFSFEEGVRLVAARGKAMQEAATAVPSSMVAIMGADEGVLAALIAESAGGEVLVAANYNPGHVVISGAVGACERAVKVAEAKGVKAIPLTVAGAFHSPLMQPGADRMKHELASSAFVPPKLEVWSNVTGQPHGPDVAEIKRLLVNQITHSVLWEQTLKALLERAPEANLVELAPGKVLAGHVRKIARRANLVSLGV
jgi:[acyl-carrier-protein] S-malonyltransferase